MNLDALQLLCDTLSVSDSLVRKLIRDYPVDYFDDDTWDMINAVVSTVKRFRELPCTNTL